MFNRVLEYFKQICSLPHGSGNTGYISDFLSDFAVSNSLRHIKDTLGNVIIFKGGTEGYETSPAVILQGHIDMVCVSDEGRQINFSSEGLTLCEDDDFIWADGTTLGGDDGIAVAMILALLESDSIAHPPLEAVFTVDEETGMFGAQAIDTAPLSGRRMINLDSEEEDTLLVSCAGGVRLDAHFAFERIPTDKKSLSVTLSGLIGGHSGTEIDKGRLNAIIALTKIISSIDKISLVSLDGGSADNAIPTFCRAVIVCENEIEAKDRLSQAFQHLKQSSLTESNMVLITESTEAQSALSVDDTERLLSCIATVPDGVISMSQDVSGLVQTSLNLGVVKTDTDGVTFHHALRSSVDGEKVELEKRLTDCYNSYNAEVRLFGEYPAWEYKKDSVLQRVIAEEYEKMHGEKMKVTAIHAGLECGLFCGKIENLDCVSMGPDIFDIHTTAERLSKKSAQRVLELLVNVLARLG